MGSHYRLNTRLNFRREGGAPTRLETDMHTDLFRGGGEIALLGMEHLPNEVQAFGIAVEQLIGYA